LIVDLNRTYFSGCESYDITGNRLKHKLYKNKTCGFWRRVSNLPITI